MNYQDLNQIIRYIKKSFPCNRCQKDYQVNEIEVISTFEDQGLLHLSCGQCQNQLIIHVTISDQETGIKEASGIKETSTSKNERKHRSLKNPAREKKTTAAIITGDDVLDMINYFKNFKGDFKKIFSTKK